MSRSGLPSTVFLEFHDADTGAPRVMGTDAIFFVDGRKSRSTIRHEMYSRAQTIMRRSMVFKGEYSLPGDYSGRTYTI